jgi:hypothetical protein
METSPLLRELSELDVVLLSNHARACHVLLLFPSNFDRTPVGATGLKGLGMAGLCVLIRHYSGRDKTHLAGDGTTRRISTAVKSGGTESKYSNQMQAVTPSP